ncbi:MAG: response regulator [Vicinamibacterales bacterium]
MRLRNRTSPVVLVVEDDAQLRQLAADTLACSGYEVVEARDGREAIDQLQVHAPDLVLLDLNMPVMDGWQFRAEQRRLPERRLATIPVVLLTAVEAAQGHATLLQAAGLVTKPFDPDTLLNTVQSALRH